ncbi:hypothetical protein R70723_24250 [Paenibacillus sp. FSL R7-0273]|uniref:YolD-like family protein n=1 Tax=Paenibacillus sp. FSL R7-0273 TaxID=1536772 RepID=UPI0004F619C6|nr:YolD-like family protein [Paenibacillus sp. FSL R7-0273]AIQ48673.1 hypothetical protein R70723_24250 [Paenibacillus sp. FSL R7-0273]OMF93982.1 hypothetical protein BK144_10310 [Paenibacillus sp. FSL R7-0273]
MGKQLEEGLQEGRRMLPEQVQEVCTAEYDIVSNDGRPDLQQKLKEIEQTLAVSLKYHKRVSVVLHGQGEPRQISGFVTSIHTHSREIKLQWAEEWKWVHVDDIAEACIL